MKISAVDPVGIADGDGRKLELCLIDHDEVGYNIVLEIAGEFEKCNVAHSCLGVAIHSNGLS